MNSAINANKDLYDKLNKLPEIEALNDIEIEEKTDVDTKNKEINYINFYNITFEIYK